jgi:hypothetical protein
VDVVCGAATANTGFSSHYWNLRPQSKVPVVLHMAWLWYSISTVCETYLLVDAFQIICITVCCGDDLYGHQLPSGLVPGLVHRAICTPPCRQQHMKVHQAMCIRSL